MADLLGRRKDTLGAPRVVRRGRHSTRSVPGRAGLRRRINRSRVRVPGGHDSRRRVVMARRARCRRRPRIRRVPPAAARSVPALQRMDVALVPTGARSRLVRLAVAGAVQDGTADCAVLDRDLARGLPVAVQLRLLRLRLRMRLVSRGVRRLHAFACRSRLLGDRRRGRRRGRRRLRRRRRVLLHLPRRARRVAGRCVSRACVPLAVPARVSVPVARVRRDGEREDAENEHARALQPHGHPPP